MKGYFQYLGYFLEEFFWRIFLGGFFVRIFFVRILLGGYFWEDFWKEFFGRNYLVEINKELMFLSRFWGNFVSMQGRKEGGFSILRSAMQAHRT